MEGSETEPRYFECLFSKYRMTNSEVFFFAKEKNEIGWSNPLKLIDYIETKAVKEKLSSSYLSARNVLLDLFSQNSKNLDVRLFKTEYMKSVEKKKAKLTDKIDIPTLRDILIGLKDYFFKGMIIENFENIVLDLPNIFDDITFASGIDKIVLVVDRDARSFSTEQYDQVLNRCQKEGYEFLVSNPCFEFYLALHLSDCKHLDIDKLSENQIDKKGNSYAYKALKDLDPDYSKSKYDPDKYIQCLDNAISNSKQFETDIFKLKTFVGTNIPEWIMKVKQ